ncbi:hypothetical protein RHMOL_Rhmol10G0232500 [Rhododendron molle]|uniref:Uncharacterized protein n=1 Tax=Rhododendron molle TaxID=49168 RepID=A0ACC0M5E5_RHOML|nr:hypothetical protein RHMOL_Rhmol10G0232500 [Rhododendron molle]
MKIFSWNIRCLGSSMKRRFLTGLIKERCSNFMRVQETKEEQFEATNVQGLWGNCEVEYAVSEAEGSSGGLLIMWDKEAFKAVTTVIHKQLASCLMLLLFVTGQSSSIELQGAQTPSTPLFWRAKSCYWRKDLCAWTSLSTPNLWRAKRYGGMKLSIDVYFGIAGHPFNSIYWRAKSFWILDVDSEIKMCEEWWGDVCDGGVGGGVVLVEYDGGRVVAVGGGGGGVVMDVEWLWPWWWWSGGGRVGRVVVYM